MPKLSTTFALTALLAACSSGSDPGESGRDLTPPVIEIDSPARGTMAEGTVVRVTGRVIDDSEIAEVRVNGQVADLAGSSFAIELVGTAGINVIQTQATDAAGNTAADARAILMGNLAEQGTPIKNGVVTKLDGTAMASLGGLISGVASATDFTAIARALNPVVNTGDGCNSAKAYVDSIAKSSVPVTAKPIAGGIQTAVSVKGLVVKGRVTFRALCVSGSASYTITASSYNVGGRIRPTLSGGDIQVALDNVTSAFVGFKLDIGGVPSFVEDLIKNQVRDRLAAILRDKVQQMVPQLATSFLADFLADDYAVAAMGQTIDLSITPTAMSWTEAGGRIALDTTSVVRGVEGASFLSTPTDAPEAMGPAGLAVALADDVANQLLAGMWTSGALEIGYTPGAGDPVRAFFPDAESLAIELMLPPVVNADTTTGTMKLAIGDAMVDVLAPGGVSLARFAISAELDLSATLNAEGKMKLVTGTPKVIGQVLSQSDTLPIELDDAKVAAFAELAISQMASKTDDLFGTLPIPGVPGAQLSSPTFEPRGGYVVLGGTITAP
jgi:hypothetical protein